MAETSIKGLDVLYVAIEREKVLALSSTEGATSLYTHTYPLHYKDK